MTYDCELSGLDPLFSWLWLLHLFDLNINSLYTIYGKNNNLHFPLLTFGASTLQLLMVNEIDSDYCGYCVYRRVIVKCNRIRAPGLEKIITWTPKFVSFRHNDSRQKKGQGKISRRAPQCQICLLLAGDFYDRLPIPSPLFMLFEWLLTCWIEANSVTPCLQSRTKFHKRVIISLAIYAFWC